MISFVSSIMSSRYARASSVSDMFITIIIQSQTGLRINEVLSIQEGCVKRTADGYDYMEVTLGKTEKGEPIIHKVFINDLVKDAITELSEYTAELRKESGLKELFLCRIKSQNNKIAPYTETHWNDKKLRYFIFRTYICASDSWGTILFVPVLPVRKPL